MKKISKRKDDEAFAKSLFYVKSAILFDMYKEYKSCFENILKVLEKWLDYYIKDGNLLIISDEEVEIWLTILMYYGSCRKGEV
ncbi:MAG: hypothetical protein E7172_06205 [Firmicutes bacterium]|nr:hypothetical protein [Bacillota bacterium]